MEIEYEWPHAVVLTRWDPVKGGYRGVVASTFSAEREREGETSWRGELFITPQIWTYPQDARDRALKWAKENGVETAHVWR